MSKPAPLGLARPPARVWLQVLIALSVLLFVPGLQESFEPPKVAAVRWIGLTFLALALATRPRVRSGLDVAVVAWLAVEIASTLASASPALSLVGEPVQREGLLTSLALAGVYAAVRGLTARAPSPAGTLAPLVDATLAAGAVTAATALLQAAGHDPFGWGPSYRFGPTGAARAFGTLGHPNLMGAFAAAASCLAWGGAAQQHRHRWARVASLALLSAACAFTFSRGAWLGWLAGMLATGLLLARGGSTAGRLAVAGSMLAGAVALLTGASGWHTFVSRLADLSPASGTGATRVEIWRAALAMWRAHPLLGLGPDTFALGFPRFQTSQYWRLEWAGLPVHAHSVVLHALATRGLVGIAAALGWAAAFVATWLRAWRLRPEWHPLLAGVAGAALALVVAGLFGALGITGALLVVVLSGALAGTVSPQPDSPAAGGARRAVVVTVAVLATVWTMASLVAARASWQAETALDRARSEADASSAERSIAVAHSGTATRLAPWDDRNHRARSDALLGTAPFAPNPLERLAAALDAGQRALRLAPTRAENHEQCARVLTARTLIGDTASATAAAAEIEQMSRLAPANALLLDEAARLSLVLGRHDRARALARRVVALYPTDSPAWLTLAEAEAAAGDSAAARAALNEAEAGDWHGNEEARQASREWLEHWR